MCGIVGYIGYEQASPFLLDGLEKLEYRGYDSAGVAVYTGEELKVIKAKGRLKNLANLLNGGENLTGTVGIGHTRWATHGKPSDLNSHPHTSMNGKFAVVHNGIIENYISLKNELEKAGKVFVSDTDTEVAAQLLEYLYDGNILNTAIKFIDKVEGSYALGIINADNPDEIIAIRKDSPLILGFGENENFIASDIPAILSKTRDIYRLGDKEIALLKRDEVIIYNNKGEPIDIVKTHIDWDIAAAEKCGYEHFMLKEIMEQPKALHDTINTRIVDGKIKLDNVELTEEYLKGIKKICIVACGSAYHVGCIGKYVFESLLRIPVEVDLASEFRYRNPIIDENVLFITISQSGETADTLAALREAKKLGARAISIVNVVGSSVACESDDVIYTLAGPEIAVATTKAYSTQLSVIYMLALDMGYKLSLINESDYEMYINSLKSIPNKVGETLKNLDKIREFASQHYDCNSAFFIGRNIDYAVSLEGSLKLKEISYISAEAYAAGELKHGTISLIEDGTLVVALATQPRLVDKTVSNIKEVKARGAIVLGIARDGNKSMEKAADVNFYIPEICDLMAPSLTVVILQLLSYYIAYDRGCDIDKPRNLAKSVTVE